MMYQCDKCMAIHEDDEMKCTCGSTEVTRLDYCNECGGSYEYDEINMNGGLCMSCYEDMIEEV